MYIEASGKSKGMTAKMFSPKYRGLNPQCIEFFYHMHGRTTGTFTIYSKVRTNCLSYVFVTKHDQIKMCARISGAAHINIGTFTFTS